MTTATTPVMSGHCGIRRHQQCRGLYAGHPCPCDCHTDPEPEPEPPQQAAPPAPTPSSPRRHCATCSCEDPQ